MGYRFKSEEEKVEAERWMTEHGKELPRMDAGYRINGDPIIYSDFPDTAQIAGMFPHRFERHIDDAEVRPAEVTTEMLREACRKAKLTPLQAWVLVMRSFGMTLEEIGGTLGITKQSVDEIEEAAQRKIRKRLVR